MKKYFYSNGKEKQGPYSFEELMNEDITKETLIWFEGLENWTPAKEIKELEEILQLLPPPIVADRIDSISGDNKFHERNENNHFIIEVHHPWRRFFARTVDLFTFGILIFMSFSFVFGYFFPNNFVEFLKFIENPIFTALILYLLWIPFEALFLSLAGTTPAKWIFGIHVVRKSGKNLSYTKAMERAFLVFLKGEGLGIPLVILITRIFAYQRLNNTGTTLWDTSVDSIVTYKKWSIIRAIASVFITLIALMILAMLNSMGNAYR